MQVRYVSALPGIRVSSYWTGDATVRWTADQHLRFEVARKNLFQPQHIEFSYDPGPAVGIRRIIFAELTFTR